MPIRAIAFDLDGTLLDSLRELAASANAALEAMGLPAHPEDAYRRFVGDGMDMLARRALPGDEPSPEDIARLAEAVRAQYERRWPESRPYPGVAELLDALAGRGLPAMILSNEPDAFTRRIVERTLGGWPWAAVRGAMPGTPLKPDPAGALALAQAMGLDPSHMALVGDSDVDVLTARAAGMRAVGALWGFRGRAELAAAGAHALIASPPDLLDLPDQLGAS